jgi:carboxyl-terminal processing protease
LVAGIVVAVLVVMGTVFALGYWAGTGHRVADSVDTGDSIAVVQDAYREIRENAVDPPSSDKLAQGAVRGMLKVLQRRSEDHYATFFTPHDYRSVQELTSGRFSGIGVWLKKNGATLKVVSVLPDTPADRVGLQKGDLIRRVDGRSVSSMSTDEAVARIKGRIGTEVSLAVTREGRELSFRIARASIELPDAIDRMVAGNLGYIRLFGFARGAGGQVRRDVEELRERGAKGIILDLRDNGGGLFTEGIAVASVFVEDGVVVRYKERSQPEVSYKAQGDAFEDIPLVVLVNGGTASASEIVTGALQDRHRAIVVGTRTYGKGSVQQVVPLPDSAAMKLTTAAYYTPSGRSINGVGITPDVKVGAPATQRLRAIEILKGMVLSSTNAQG